MAATRAKAVVKKKKGAKPTKRSYSFKTIKVLFGLAGNRCAVPGCTNPIITPGTTLSEDAVIGQICHIYAVSNEGPRGRPGLTEAEKNSAANLILCCPTHHAVIDKQYDDYRFSFVIDREGSDGVGQMVVFCFDLAVATVWAKLKKGFGSLIHDSTLFADVDPRQVASALTNQFISIFMLQAA